MQDFKYILFDLDGTLTDPGLGITNSVMYALDKMGIKSPERSELYKFIGPPLWESFEKSFGLSSADTDRAVSFYREYFKDIGIFENILIEGIEPLLKLLKENGKEIILATSKPEPFAKQILTHFDIDKYFDFAAGSSLDRSRNEKAEVIAYALESCKITEKKYAVMVGDRKHDILGASINDISSIGVLFGFGSREELEAAGANFIAETVNELETLLLK